MGSGFDDWVYWHFFDYNIRHIKLLLNDVCLTNLYDESRTDLYCLLSLLGGSHGRQHVEQLIVLRSPTGCPGNLVLRNLLPG
jgi:hypothetical protein